MHLLIDIRRSNSDDPHMVHYASCWVDLWRARHSGDMITYLIHDGQGTPDNAPSLIIPQERWWKKKKPIALPNIRETFRVLSFSKLPPYDHALRTITHITDHLDILYPPPDESYLERRDQIRRARDQIRYSDHIITHSLQVGEESVELLGARESMINVIPYLHLSTIEPSEQDPHIIDTLGIHPPYWIHDGGYGGESHITELIDGYAKYRNIGGDHTLVLLGDMGPHMSRVMDQIRTLDLSSSIRIIGNPPMSDQHQIYAQANGWISIGAYSRTGSRIQLATDYHLPKLISDIALFESYRAKSLCIHPNHLGNIADRLMELASHTQVSVPDTDLNDQIMSQYEQILSQK